MPVQNPIARLLTGLGVGARTLEPVVPRRTFDDVILPPATRRAVDLALVQVTSRELVFHQWGLAERHPTGLALAFNFAGPPNTGKTVCAEAIAHALGRRLLVVRCAELESMWMGDTPKQVVAAFRTAREEQAVLFFDEADAIAARRSTLLDQAASREANTTVSVLLQELEAFDGVVIFATNLATNLDPAFERRVRTHVRFERPGPVEREAIWRVQIHPRLTPLAADVDFGALAARHEVSGGDIRNAVLKAALAAAAEPGPDARKRIHQRHLEAGMAEVLAAKAVMRQSLYEDDASTRGTTPPRHRGVRPAGRRGGIRGRAAAWLAGRAPASDARGARAGGRHRGAGGGARALSGRRAFESAGGRCWPPGPATPEQPPGDEQEQQRPANLGGGVDEQHDARVPAFRRPAVHLRHVPDGDVRE